MPAGSTQLVNLVTKNKKKKTKRREIVVSLSSASIETFDPLRRPADRSRFRPSVNVRRAYRRSAPPPSARPIDRQPGLAASLPRVRRQFRPELAGVDSHPGRAQAADLPDLKGGFYSPRGALSAIHFGVWVVCVVEVFWRSIGIVFVAGFGSLGFSTG